MRRDAEEMRREWELGSTGIVPTKPGYYWMYIQRWRMYQVGLVDGVLSVLRLRNQPVSRVYPDRWGPMFSEEV